MFINISTIDFNEGGTPVPPTPPTPTGRTAEVGDIVLYSIEDESLFFVPQNEYNPNAYVRTYYPPIGIVTKNQESINEEVKFIGNKWMDIENPDEGTSSTGSTNKPIWGDETIDISGLTNYGSWSRALEEGCKGKQNTAEVLKYATGQTDWQTASTISSGSSMFPLFECSWRYNPSGTSQGDWYIGNVGDYYEITGNDNKVKTAIAEGFNLIGGPWLDGVSNVGGWTSNDTNNNNESFRYVPDGDQLLFPAYFKNAALSTIPFCEKRMACIPDTPREKKRLSGTIYNDNTEETFNIYCSDANEEYPQTPISILIDGEEVINNLQTMAYPSTGAAFSATTVYYLDASGYTNGEHTIEYIFNDRITIIPNKFFAKTNIITIDIPNTVRELHGHSFSYNNYLTEITIPESVTSLGRNLFYNCYGLESCTFLGKPTEIPWSCFCNCTGLTSSGLTLDTSEITTIGNYAFAATNLTGSISFPKLESLGDYAFESAKISSFEATALTEDVGAYAFASAFTLTNVVLNGTYTAVGRNAFWYCTGLTAVTLADTVTSLGNSLFNNCHSLTNLTLPPRVEMLGQYCFNRCISLTGLTFNNQNIDIQNYCFSNMGDNGGEGFDFHFSKCSAIRNSVFSGTTINELYIPSGLTYLSSGFTLGCTSIQTLEFEEGYNLGNYNNNNTLRLSGNSTKKLYITNLILPDSLAKIVAANYSYVTGDLYIGANNGTIGNNFLKNARRIIYSDNHQDTYSGETVGLYLNLDLYDSPLEDIHFPPKTCLGNSTLFPPSLTGVNYNNIYVTENGSFMNCTGLTGDVVFGNCKEIGSYTFYNTRLSSVTITGNTDCTIGSYAFAYNPSLTAFTVTIDASLTTQSDMFLGCTGLTSINITSRTTDVNLGSISNGQECSLSNYFHLPLAGGTPKTYLSGAGFRGCTNLTVANPHEVFVITDTFGNEFNGCTALTSVYTLFDNGGTVPDNIFSGCTSISALTFDSGVTYINDFGAGSMTSLRSVKLESLTPPTLRNASVFITPNGPAIVFVPSSALSDYMTLANDPTSPWAPYKNYLIGF